MFLNLLAFLHAQQLHEFSMSSNTKSDIEHVFWQAEIIYSSLWRLVEKEEKDNNPVIKTIVFILTQGSTPRNKGFTPSHIKCINDGTTLSRI